MGAQRYGLFQWNLIQVITNTSIWKTQIFKKFEKFKAWKFLHLKKCHYFCTGVYYKEPEHILPPNHENLDTRRGHICRIWFLRRFYENTKSVLLCGPDDVIRMTGFYLVASRAIAMVDIVCTWFLLAAHSVNTTIMWCELICMFNQSTYQALVLRR